MNRVTKRLLAMPFALALLSLTGCDTPQQKPYTPPPAQTRMPPPPTETQSQPPQQASEAAASGQQAAMQQPAAPPADSGQASTAQQAQSTAPARDTTADVEITDIPVDENGNPIVAESPPGGEPRSPDDSKASSQAGGGGSPTPRYGQREDDTGGSTGGAPRIDGTEAGPVINIGAKTDAERLAALDQDLDGKLAQFDELMRRAREEAEQERAAGGGGQPGGGSGGYAGQEDGRGARDYPPPQGRGGGGQADTSSGLGHTPDVTGSAQGGDFNYASAGPIPNDIPDARDDDIVARQLREAATRETDPVLREKLWDEYRKYRKGIGR